MSGLDQARFREVLGHFATGVTVVTALDEGDPVGFTCQAFAALSLDPPMVILAPARTSTSWPRIARAGAFCVNILEERQEALGRAFAATGTDRFDGTSWSPGTTGAPVLEGVLAVVECRLGAIHDGGDHELVTGHVVATQINTGEPLIFYRSSYGRFAP